MRKFIIVGISFVVFVILLSFSFSMNDSTAHADAAETVLADHTTCAETKEALQTDIAAILSATPSATATPFKDIALIELYGEPRDSVDEVTLYFKVKNVGTQAFTDTLVTAFMPLGPYGPDREMSWTGGLAPGETIGMNAISSIKTIPGETPHICVNTAYGAQSDDINTANNSDVLYFPDYATPTATPTVTPTPTVAPYLACDITAALNITTSELTIDYTAWYTTPITDAHHVDTYLYVDNVLCDTRMFNWTNSSPSSGSITESVSQTLHAEQHTVRWILRSQEHAPLGGECVTYFGEQTAYRERVIMISVFLIMCSTVLFIIILIFRRH